MEGATGLDTEFVVAGEPFPATIFGFLPAPSNTYWNQTRPPVPGRRPRDDQGRRRRDGHLHPAEGRAEPADRSASRARRSTTRSTSRGSPCPTSTAATPPSGSAAATPTARSRSTTSPTAPTPLTYWDEPQDYILDLLSVTVSDGETVDMGILPLAGWWTKFDGYVFNDTNRNGKRDAGEPGVPNFGLTLRSRDNIADGPRLAPRSPPTSPGTTSFEQAYPLTEWLVLEAYDDRYYTTGVTYQADNQPEPTTVLGAGRRRQRAADHRPERHARLGRPRLRRRPARNGVDPQNGGIVGSISYDTTRNELDPQYAAAEDWQPGVSGITVELYAPVDCGTNAGHAVRRERRLRARRRTARTPRASCSTPTSRRPGSGRPTASRATSTATRSSNPGDQQVLPIGDGKGCLEGPLMGVQFGPYPTDQGTPDANFGAAVDGNYGFGDGCFDGTLDATDPVSPDVRRRRVHRRSTPATTSSISTSATRSTSAATRSTRSPAKRTSTSATATSSSRRCRRRRAPARCTPWTSPTTAPTATGHDRRRPSGNGGRGLTVPASTPTDNPTFVDIGASPYEGQAAPAVRHQARLAPERQVGRPDVQRLHRRAAPGPLLRPDRRRPQVLDRPQVAALRREGRRALQPGRHLRLHEPADHTVETDYNGIFDVLLPSTNRINCPTPSGVCANLYRFVGNDPGMPGPAQPELQPAVPDDRRRVRGDARADHPGRHRPDPGRRHRPAARLTAEHPARLPGERPGRDRGQPRPRAVRGLAAVHDRHRDRRSRSTARASAPPRAPAS